MDTEKLIERLRREAADWDEPKSDGEVDMRGLLHGAADALEASTRREREMREALRLYVYETTHLSPMEDDGSHWCNISAECLSKARTTLSQEGL